MLAVRFDIDQKGLAECRFSQARAAGSARPVWAVSMTGWRQSLI